MQADEEIHSRKEMPDDADSIRRVVTAAFREVARSDGSEADIVDRLRRAGALAISRVALRNGELVGHVAVSPVRVSDGSDGWYGLGPIAVLPEAQGRGVGSRLMREATDALRERAAAGCVLLGEPDYYGRFGFRRREGLLLPGVPPEYFLALPFGGRVPEGNVTYHEAFTG